jgi:hypothetical protein
MMADDKKIRVPADRGRVNVNEDYELRYWTKELKCTEAELRDAVRVVGVMVDRVIAYLQDQKERREAL